MAKLTDLPNEIILIVLAQSAPEDLCAVSCVNKHLSVISSDNFLWKRFCGRLWDTEKLANTHR